MKNILIIDSGSGGINVLCKCLKVCKGNYLLYLDQKNSPYGNKAPQKLKEIAINIIKDVSQSFHPDVIIIGCNTLTSVAINELRRLFKDVIFIGAEPAISPALKEFRKEEILVLATNVTIKNSRILKDYQKNCVSPTDLPKTIDKNLFNRGNILKYLKVNLPKTDCKAVVLGCTHFEGIKDELKTIFGDVKFFESGEGIAKRLKSFCGEENSYKVKIETSGDKKDLEKFYNYYIKLMSKDLKSY